MPTSEFTGEEVDSASPEWRHECEVRWLLDELDVQGRRRYVNGELGGAKGDLVISKGVRQRRGAAAADRIIEDLRRLHALRQQRARVASTPAAAAAIQED